MCGLFGHTIPGDGWSVERSRDALHTLSHRGPDQWSDWHDQRLYIGHRRLSILDLSEQGRQPMISADGQVVISVNGEIYNFKTLREGLQAKYRFRSQSDSEIVLHGYREWGIERLLDKIDGMYAIQIYDIAQGKLYLARDRCGIKPLYYSVKDGEIAWASELKALVSHHESGLEHDFTALYDFLTYRYIPAPKTMYKDVFKLEPGTFLSVEMNGAVRPRLQRYWKLDPHLEPITTDAAIKEFRRLLKDSVTEQMVADVPVGFFLSGGLDSSSVVASASGTGNTLHTYSIGFAEKNHDETAHAGVVAKAFNTLHDVKVLDSATTEGLFSNLRTWYDEPFADTSAFPSFLVAAFARESLKVVLTGDGGDEICGGYKWYAFFGARGEGRKTSHALAKITARLKSWSPSVVRRALGFLERNYLYSDLDLLVKYMGGMTREEKWKYARAWGIPADYDDLWYFRKYYRADLPLKTRLQYLDFNTYLPDDILTKVDRVTMAVSLEARVPLLSRQLVEFCFSLPEDIRYSDGELKGIMKRAMSGILPVSILQREKKGFSIPLKAWSGGLAQGHDAVPQRILHELFAIPEP